MFYPWIGKIPWSRHGNPLQYPSLENSHGQRHLGYSPWGHKESDTTKQLNTHTCDNLEMRYLAILLNK